MITTFLLWFILGTFIGLLVFFTAGFLTMPFDTAWQLKASNYYSKLAQKLIGRSGLLERGTKWDLVSVDTDDEKNADTFDLGDDEAHVTNDTGLLSRWFKQPFGLLAPPDANVSVWLGPLVAELGEVEVNRKEQGDMLDEDGQYVEQVDLPDRRPGIKLREFARAMIPGSRAYQDLSESVSLYKESQRGYANSKTVQFMLIIVAYAVGAGMTWVIVTQAGGVGDAITMPISMGGPL